MSIEKHKADIISSLSDHCEICPDLDVCMKNDCRDINMYCEEVVNNLIEKLAILLEKSRGFLDIIFKDYFDTEKEINLAINALKADGFIRQNAYEELMDETEKLKNVIFAGQAVLSDVDKLKQKIIAYHDEKHSISPAVKEAREKIDRFIDERIQCNKLWSAEELWELIQSERNAVDKE